jgi:antitoxin (DNA-binding transcriptional repressor) of toxin-antitoxin stability system
MKVSATQLRADIYRLLDRIIETGQALEVERRGVTLRIAPTSRRPLAELFPPDNDLVVGDLDDLVELDWSDTWQPG